MPKDHLTLFVEQVNLMRACQREFYRSRSQLALFASKDLEQDVDQQLADILGIETVTRARDLAREAYDRHQ